MTPIHKQLAGGKWFTLTSMEQLGNIGSEIERTLRAREKGDTARCSAAFERALELIDLTVSDPKWRMRLKELLRTREAFCDYLFGDNEYRITAEQIRKDFLAYGAAARTKVLRQKNDFGTALPKTTNF
ncbi:hypothetical protein HYV71_00025 [Candidatus Uhrbacteria bacterium]|nr:hypothetical protein [Candidatus Uhrbacteria bacterium]